MKGEKKIVSIRKIVGTGVLPLSKELTEIKVDVGDYVVIYRDGERLVIEKLELKNGGREE
ncbi:MAG: hypothetical protein OCU22_07690 [Canidatus Methanoxibalbensis ujae]|nr:hypothetical protein [Candidatus Methanoxibalbensis ujae]